MYLITHNDLDGIGCSFVAREAMPDIYSIACSQSDVDDAILKALDDFPDFILISDIWTKNEQVLKRLRSFRGKLLVFDHHDSSIDSQESVLNAKVFYNPYQSATKQMATFFDVRYPSIDLIDEYDTTGTIEGLAGDLNSLFWNKTHMYMCDVFKRKPFHFTKEEEDLIASLKKERERYFNILKPQHFDINGYTVCYIDKVGHRSYVLKRLQNNADIVIMNSVDNVSIRSTGAEAVKIAKQLGGGGHDKAAGAPGNYTKMQIVNAAKAVL